MLFPILTPSDMTSPAGMQLQHLVRKCCPPLIHADMFLSAPTAEVVHDWLARQLPDRPHPPVYRPYNYVLWVKVIFIILGITGLIFKLRRWLWPLLRSRNTWAGLSLIAILVFTSGHMFNQIRKVPYVAGDGHGGISYFAAGFQNQYGLETQIIAFICRRPIRSSCPRPPANLLQMVFYLSLPYPLP